MRAACSALPLQLDAAAVEPLQARERVDELGLAVALHARDAQDLPGADLQAHAVERVPLLLDDRGAAQGHDDLVLAGHLVLLRLEGDDAPHHELCELALVHVLGGDGGDDLAFAQDGHRVGQGQGLLELVGDDEDGLAALLEPAQHLEQVRDLLRREHGRGSSRMRSSALR